MYVLVANSLKGVAKIVGGAVFFLTYFPSVILLASPSAYKSYYRPKTKD